MPDEHINNSLKTFWLFKAQIHFSDWFMYYFYNYPFASHSLQFSNILGILELNEIHYLEANQCSKGN